MKDFTANTCVISENTVRHFERSSSSYLQFMKNNKKEPFFLLKVFHKNVHLDKSPIEKVSIIKIIVTNFCNSHSR